jgi:hypothetical protein
MTDEDLFLFLSGVVAALVGTQVWRLLRWSRRSRLPGVLLSFFGKDPYQLPIVSRTFIADFRRGKSTDVFSRRGRWRTKKSWHAV